MRRGAVASARLRILAVPAAAAAAGMAAGLGFAPYRAWPATALACAVWLALASRERRVPRALLTGWLFGLGLFAPGLSWLFTGLDLRPHPLLAVAGPASMIAALALLPAGVAGAAAAARIAPALKQTLLVPALWVVTEWLRHQTALAFPWLALGYTQVPAGPLAPFAPMVGVLGVSFLLLICAGLIASAVAPGPAAARRRALFALAAMLLAASVAARVSWTAPQGAPLRAALLQGNVPLTEKFTPTQTKRALLTYAALAARSRAPLVVMPETALPLFEHQLPPDLVAYLGRLATERGGDIVLSHFRRGPGPGLGYFSSAHVLGVSGEQRYDKRHLLPFGEFVPFPELLRSAYERITKVKMLDTSPGSPIQGGLVLAGRRAALRMCYEDAFGSEHREEIARAGFLVTLANDSWDGATAPMDQHLQISQGRALEAAKPLLRAANTGWSAVIDRHGRILAWAPRLEAVLLEAEIQPRGGVTPYLRLGDALPLGLAGLALLFCAAAEWMARQPAGDKQP